MTCGTPCRLHWYCTRWLRRGRLRSHRGVNAALRTHLLIINHIHCGKSAHPARRLHSTQNCKYEVSNCAEFSPARTRFDTTKQNTPQNRAICSCSFFLPIRRGRLPSYALTARSTVSCNNMNHTCLRTTLCVQCRPNVESFAISDYVSLFFFVPPCGNASFLLSLRLHNRAFTCAYLIRVMLQGVLPIQNVAAPRRSPPKAPKPNVVNAWRGGPLSPALDSRRTP